jgi:hypothetical protein
MVRRSSGARRVKDMQRYTIIIKGHNFEDVDSAELPAPPQPGETIETSLGQCIVTSTESPPIDSASGGKIICRLP